MHPDTDDIDVAVSPGRLGEVVETRRPVLDLVGGMCLISDAQSVSD